MFLHPDRVNTQVTIVGASASRLMIDDKRILYVQYTNPGAYPPLEHSSRILADAGWRVHFLGTGSKGANELAFPPHPNIDIRLWRFQPPGWKQKLHYLGFAAWCLAWCVVWRPKVVYCSDLWSAPVGMLVWYLFRVPVVFHEHDTPGPPTNWVLRFVHSMRRQLAHVAVVCVIPQMERLARFVESLRPRRAVCVWNCPRRDEVVALDRARPSDGLHLFYVGSLHAVLLPEAVIGALSELSDGVHLHVVGYETVGSVGYVERLRRCATQLGVAGRLHFYGPLARRDFFRIASGCDIGLCLISTRDEVNLRFLFGASNKIFDYLACGLAVVVPDEPEWTSHIVAPGYGIGCDVHSAKILSSTLRELQSNRARYRGMGELGRQRILRDWSYETQFKPVERLLNSL